MSFLFEIGLEAVNKIICINLINWWFYFVGYENMNFHIPIQFVDRIFKKSIDTKSSFNYKVKTYQIT